MGYQAGVPTLLAFGLVIHRGGGEYLVQMNNISDFFIDIDEIICPYICVLQSILG